MKKILLLIIAVVLCAGAIFVGNTIFNTKNIDTIEIEGEMQTLYLLNETDTPNFEDAKLKITYKNGKVDYKSMKDVFKIKDKDFNYFTTSYIKDSDTMSLVYKSHMIEVKYTVVNSGMFYLSGDEKIEYVSNKPQTVSSNQYTLKTTNSFIYLETKDPVVKKESGRKGVRFYSYSTEENDWLLYDGNYLKNYSYEINGDRILVYLGSDTPTYEMKAGVKAGYPYLYSVKNEKDSNTNLDISRETFYFTNYSEAVTNSKAIQLNQAPICDDYLTDELGTKYLEFNRHDTIATSSHKIYLDVEFSNYLIYTSDGVKLFKRVLVVFSDELIKNETFNTSIPKSNSAPPILFAYEGLGTAILDYGIYYKVN